MGECSGDEARVGAVGGVCISSRWDGRAIQIEIDAQCRRLGKHQSDPALDAVVESSALVVERIQAVILRKLQSVGFKVLGGFAVCL